MSKVIITLMNIVLVLVPLIATIFGVMYFYSSRDFTELLLAQPIARRQIFLGQYVGLVFSLALCIIIGIGVPFTIFGVFGSSEIWNYFSLLGIGVCLSMIFGAFSILIGIAFDNKIKGFGFAIFLWLFFAIIYDGIFLILLNIFSDYPLDRFALIMAMANPIDLGRILILLKLDISALMGYTGAVFNQVLGNAGGMIISLGILLLWTFVPVHFFCRIASKKDF